MSFIEHTLHPVASALSWAIIHSLWQFTLIMVLAHLALRLSGKTSTYIRHVINLFALLAIPLCFAITFIRQYNIYNTARMVVSIESDDASWITTTGASDFYLIDKSLPLFFGHLETLTPAIFWLYITGLSILSLHGIYCYLRVNAMKRRKTVTLPPYWSDQLSRIKSKAEIIKDIGVFASEYVQTPVVVGVIRTVVLLPLTMFTALTPDQIETILLHEFRHIRNKDHIINILQNLLEIVFFFHPAIWWISRQLRREREKRVDEWVVNHTNAPLIYAKALLSLEKNRSRVLQPALAATHSKKLLLVRIKNIMTMKTKRWDTGRNLAALIIIMTSACMLTLFDPGYGITASTTNKHFNITSEAYTQLYGTGQHAEPFLEGMPDMPPARQNSVKNTNLTQAGNQPKNLVLDDGTSIKWDDMSAKDQDELQRAMKELRMAVTEVNKELVDKFNSEAFKQQMRQAQKEVGRTTQASQRIQQEDLRAQQGEHRIRQEELRARHEELRVQQESLRAHYLAQEEILRAQHLARKEEISAHHETIREQHLARKEEISAHHEMIREQHLARQEEISAHHETIREQHLARKEEINAQQESRRQTEVYVNSEAFRMEMQMAGEAVRKALEGVNRDINEYIRSEEFQQELEKIAPAVEDAIRELKINEIIKEVMDSVNKALEEVESQKEPENLKEEAETEKK